ncbi:MAG: hypothetical protein SGARI_005401 [Bacillariaceae sp.]
MDADPDFGISFDDFANATRALSIAFTTRQLSPIVLLDTENLTVALNLTDPPNKFIGPDGSFTDTLEDIHMDVTAFWASTGEISPEPIPYKGVHGSDLAGLDVLELAHLYVALGAVDATQAENFYFPGAYDNPLFTFNAMFAPIPNNPQFFWGDGYIQTTVDKGIAFERLASSTEAHEFGHYIQNQLGIWATLPLPAPSAWRYAELQADGT